jgi:hypothetical protein
MEVCNSTVFVFSYHMVINILGIRRFCLQENHTIMIYARTPSENVLQQMTSPSSEWLEPVLQFNMVTGYSGKQSPAGNWLEPVRKAIDGMRYGTVAIVVQNGAVVQIDRTEKLRLDKSSS